MNEEYKVDLSVADADDAFVIDTPKTSEIDCLEQINLPTSQCLEEICTSSARLHESVLGVSSFLQPSLVSDLCASDTVASLAGGLSTIAESVKPLSALNAVEGITNMSGLLQMKDFAFPTPALTDVLKSDSFTAASAKALTDRFSASLPDTSALGASFGNAMKIAVPEPVPFVAPVPVVEAIGEVQGARSLAESTQQILSANAEVFGEMQALTRAATDAIRSAFTEIVAPVTESLRKLSETISPIIKIGECIKDLFVSIKVPDFVSCFHDRMHEFASLFSEMINSRWQDIASGLCGLTHMMLLRIMRKRRKKKPPLPALSWRESIKTIASRVQIGLSRPERIREFVVTRRHTFLHKYQRVSEDSDDKDNNTLLINAAFVIA